MKEREWIVWLLFLAALSIAPWVSNSCRWSQYSTCLERHEAADCKELKP